MDILKLFYISLVVVRLLFQQPISKFGFAKLALVVQRPPQPVSKPAARYTRLGEVGQRPTEAAPRVRRSNVASTLDRNTQLVTV